MAQQALMAGPAALDLEDVQGLVVRGFGNLTAACYVLLTVENPADARAWLSERAGAITTSTSRPNDRALNIAVSASGLRRLGLPESILATFSVEFADGLVESHRSRILGDVGPSAPSGWSWGGPSTPPVDILVLLFASDQQALEASYGEITAGLPQGGLTKLMRLDTSDLHFKEHFGFRDGVSQPTIAGTGPAGPAMHSVQPGEFVLGYVNEHGQLNERPLVAKSSDRLHVLPDDPAGSGLADLGRNGSYLVFRQLHQDVQGFWRYADGATRSPDGGSDPAGRTALAAKMVGRWPSGAPLVRAPEHDDPALAQANDFGYFAIDRDGHRCPIGAHIRRTNPRDSLDPNPGSARSVAVGKRHRILRRGREYGPAVDPNALFGGAIDTIDRGLHFLCVCANLARQFEFIQHTWAMNPHFDGLYDNEDPLLGGRDAHRTFTVQARPVRRRYHSVPSFITVRGGGYFFLPGVRALRYLGAFEE